MPRPDQICTSCVPCGLSQKFEILLLLPILLHIALHQESIHCRVISSTPCCAYFCPRSFLPFIALERQFCALAHRMRVIAAIQVTRSLTPFIRLPFPFFQAPSPTWPTSASRTPPPASWPASGARPSAPPSSAASSSRKAASPT